MGLFKAFVSQTRKPGGFLGNMMVSGMNTGHAKLADWGFTHLPAIAPERAVDLGCGGGRNAGGIFMICNESDGTDPTSVRFGIYEEVCSRHCFQKLRRDGSRGYGPVLSGADGPRIS